MPRPTTDLSEPSTAITQAVMDALHGTLRATRPQDPYTAAVAGLLGAVLATVFSARRTRDPNTLRREVRRVARMLLQAAERLIAITRAH